MKKLLFSILPILALAGCGDSPKPVRPDDMKKGQIHFAATLALEDIIRKGQASPYIPLSPSPILNPHRTLETADVIEDFRRDFTAADNKYHLLRGSGAAIRGMVSHTDKKEREVVFVRGETLNKKTFTGKLRISLDRKFYNDGNMPVYEAGTSAVFMCAEYRPIHDFQDETVHRIEIRLIQCKTADDYYSTHQNRIRERLVDIYAGKESVSPALAKAVAMLYLTGQSLPEDSVCLYGSFLACNEKLAEELARKWGDVKVENIGAISIDPEKTTLRKTALPQSAPAALPENADRSPSGEKIHKPHPSVKEQKSAISKVKVPPGKTR